jgi:Flp pilus assembly protein TadB
MVRQSIALLTLAAFLFSPLRGLSAEQIEHLVPAAELRLRLADAAQQRQQDIRALEDLLRREESRTYLAQAGIEPKVIRQTIPHLDDETLAKFAQQSRQLDAEVAAAGYPGGRYFGLYLLVGLLILALLWGTVIANGGRA